MRSRLIFITMILALIMAVFIPVGAQENGPIEPLTPPPTAETGEMLDETPGYWFVELSGMPAADGGVKRDLKTEKDAFRLAAKKAHLAYTERYAFDTLWNGFSITMSVSELGKLHRLPGVKAVYPVEVIKMPEPTKGVDPDLFTAIAMTGADIAHSELGFTGKGINVAVMDTGIDVDHPDLGGDGTARKDSSLFPTARIAYGYDFVGDAFNADPASPSYNPTPVPDGNPDDCGGHGTHVAGIIGANGTLVGVAPEVVFGAYKVFGCEGSTTADIMIAAMERALLDDMDILNMSIGSSFQWPQYPTAVAATRLVNKGMVVVASIGNSGTSGLYAASAPGLGNKVIGVASFDNTDVYLPYFEVNGSHIGYITMTYAPNPPITGRNEIVFVGRGCLTGTGVPAGGDPYLADPNGKVALIVRGVCSFGEKADRAIKGGAVAVVVMNNAPGVFNGTLGTPLDGKTPIVGISLADGLFIQAQNAPVTLTWTNQMTLSPNPTAGLISSFSSYGLSPDLTLKPDIGAPGGNIYSSYPLELGGYATMSGTSMASPHIAGAAALVLEAHPNTNAQVMRAILQNSADPAVWSGNPGLGFLDHVHHQGAGLVDIDDSILASTRIEPGKISVGEGEAGPQEFILQIENMGQNDLTYDLSFQNALSTGGVITPSFYLSDAFVDFDKDSIAVIAGTQASVQATIYPATSPKFGQYGGHIVITPRDGGQIYRVPYAGFVGDYQEIQTLTPTSNGLPWLAFLDGASYKKVTEPTGWTFSMQGSDIPFFLVHLDHQPRMFRMEIFGANGKAWHRAYDEEYLPRNSTTTSFFAFPFDGTTVAGKKLYTLPDGEYYAVISVLKAEGDASNPSHWETWTSPGFIIARP